MTYSDVPEMLRDFQILLQNAESLNTIIKPTLPSVATWYQHQFFEIVRCLCVDRANPLARSGVGDGVGEAKNLLIRLEYHNAFQKAVTPAFVEMLEIKLQLHMSPLRYYSNLPRMGVKFQSPEMEPHTRHSSSVAAGARVHLCVRPGVKAYKRSSAERYRAVVVRPQVLFEGDDPSELFKI
jgi:hypothetical protein